jgi:hypothetical protein
MRCRACLLLLALPRAGSLAQRADRAAVVKLYHLLNGPWCHFYCRQRLPKATWGKGGTKYNWVVVAQMYETMTTSTVQGDRRCIDPHDTTFAFNSLQDSGVLAMG